jgi:2-polyprenyl-3-methyl-5-hydroxy-6-metoxy-1,4-benzoquinol methylase
MQERHKNRKKYFDEQASLTQKYVLPFISEFVTIDTNTRVAEIGCGEAGNLKPFVDIGCWVDGYDLAANKIANGNKFYSNHPNKANVHLYATDIYEVTPTDEKKYDIIIMRDTIEHIPEQHKLMGHIKSLLADNGKLFVGFPPWRMPFGGHQQMCRSFLSKVPYFHMLPKFLYVFILNVFGAKNQRKSLIEIYDTRISLNRFNRILKCRGYKVDKKQFYLINPNYEIKFGMKPRKLPRILNIPWFRDFFITTSYYLLSKHEN